MNWVDKIIKNAGGTPPVDRSKIAMASGKPKIADYTAPKANGQQKDYLVLSEEERKRGFVRPLRKSYTHMQCNTATTMSNEIAETYARDPAFYGGTFCAACSKHFPLHENGNWNFRWKDGTGVGT